MISPDEYLVTPVSRAQDCAAAATRCQARRTLRWPTRPSLTAHATATITPVAASAPLLGLSLRCASVSRVGRVRVCTWGLRTHAYGGVIIFIASTTSPLSTPAQRRGSTVHRHRQHPKLEISRACVSTTVEVQRALSTPMCKAWRGGRRPVRFTHQHLVHHPSVRQSMRLRPIAPWANGGEGGGAWGRQGVGRRAEGAAPRI